MLSLNSTCCFLLCLTLLLNYSLVGQQQMGADFLGEPGAKINKAAYSADGTRMAVQYYESVTNESVIKLSEWTGVQWEEYAGLVVPGRRVAFNFSADGDYLVAAHGGIMGNSSSNVSIQVFTVVPGVVNVVQLVHTDLIEFYLSSAHYCSAAIGQQQKIIIGFSGPENEPFRLYTFLQGVNNGTLSWDHQAPLTLENNESSREAKITLTADGARMSFFAENGPGLSQLAVYDWVNENWVPSAITLPSVALANDAGLSGNGQKLAISSYGTPASVSVYEIVAGSWTLLGEPILNRFSGPHNRYGGMSFSGDYLWYGKYFNDATPTTPRSAGCMQLYRYYYGNWLPFGDFVCGDVEHELNGLIAGVSASGQRTMTGGSYSLIDESLDGRIRCLDYSTVAPTNDRLIGAETISCGESTSGTTLGAKLDAAPLEDCAELSVDRPNVWYVYDGLDKWTAVSLCGTEWDTRLSVYVQTASGLECVGANDDYDCNEDGNWFVEEVSSVRFWGRQGLTYYIMVQESPGNGGEFEISLSCEEPGCAPEPNQSCSPSIATNGVAQLLYANGGCSVTRGDNTCSSYATSFGDCVFPDFAYQDAWYRFQTANSPMIHLKLESRGIQNAITNIYDACEGEVVQCYVGDRDELLDWLNPNTEYFIQVLSLTDRTGPFDLCLYSCTQPDIYYSDLDGDGFGDENSPLELCSSDPPQGMILQGGDCLDFHINAHEAMEEICDGWDNDCDGEIDNFCKDHVPAMLRVDSPINPGDCSGTLFAQSTGSGEWVYLLNAYGGAVAAFRDLEEMGSIEYSYRTDPDPGRLWEFTSQELPDEIVAGRDISINVQYSPQQDIPVRLFYLDTEIDNFLALAEQVLMSEDPLTFQSVNLTRANTQGCPDGSLPLVPDLLPIFDRGVCLNGYYLETNLSSLSHYFLHVNKLGAVLPVEFERTEISKVGQANELDWWVSAEEALSHYEVERSPNGRSFHPIGRLEAVGGIHYQFTDESPLTRSYYRVKAVDQDGQYQYSRLLHLQRTVGISPLRIYPNPAVGHTNVFTERAGELFLYDALGRLRRTVPLPEGSVTVDLEELPAGVYFIRFRENSRTNHQPDSATSTDDFTGNALRFVVKSH